MEKKSEIKIESVGDVEVVLIEGHLDASMANTVNEKLNDVLEGDCSKLIVDLEGLEYISSAGLRVLLYAAKKMQEKEGKTALCSIRKNVQRVLDISGLNTIFLTYEDRDVALSSMA